MPTRVKLKLNKKKRKGSHTLFKCLTVCINLEKKKTIKKITDKIQKKYFCFLNSELVFLIHVMFYYIK